MVTLNKPAAGDTDWTTEINNNWTSIEGALNGSVIHIETKVVAIAATTVSFGSLNGNSDGTYVLIARIINSSGSTVIYSLRPNGSSSSQFGVVHWAGSPAAHSYTTFSVIPLLYTDSGWHGGFHGMLLAKTGYPRYWSATSFRSSSTSNGFLEPYGGVWHDTSTNITSLDITADVASAISVGSEFRLYKVLTP